MKWEILLNVLMMIESSNNINIIGDDGQSIGCLQIQEGVIKDVNRIYKRRYTMDDRYNIQKSKDICRKYLTYWGNKALEETGQEQFTYELLARIWNGGPRGYSKDTTVTYWNKFKRIYKQMKITEVIE